MITIILQNTKDRNDLILSLIGKYIYSKTEEEKTKALQELNDNNCVLADNDSNTQSAKDEIIQFVKQNQNKMYSLPYTLKLYDDKDVNISDINNLEIFYDRDANTYHVYGFEKKQIFSFTFKVENGISTYFYGYLWSKTLNGLDLYKVINKENAQTFYAEKLFDDNAPKEVSEVMEKVTRYLTIVHDDKDSHKETERIFSSDIIESIKPLISGIDSKIEKSSYYEVNNVLCRTIEYENGYIVNILVAYTKYGTYISYAVIDKNNTDSNYSGYFKLNDTNILQLEMLLFTCQVN